MARRRALALTGGFAVLAAAVVAAVVVLQPFDSQATSADRTDGPPATAKVTRQTLLDTEQADGTLGYGRDITVRGRVAGTVTALAAVDTLMKRGQVLYRVDDTPVVLLYGTIPAYRDLAPGVEGADVKQFEQELRALGYTGFTVDDEYTSSTASAVRDWQEDLGLKETGTVTLGRVQYAPGEVRVGGLALDTGDAVQPGSSVMTLTGTARLVTVELDVADQRLAKKDGKVKVTLPGAAPVEGTITDVSTVVEASDDPNGDAETKIEVTVSIADVAGFDQASVDVTFTASERKDVLTVPVGALLALSEGGYGLEVVEGATTRVIAVETGLFASGRVEVTGDGLAEGMTVGIPK